ncbi:hypothetical protein Agub_g2445, partial [Astrephomene gubernaculifera]
MHNIHSSSPAAPASAVHGNAATPTLRRGVGPRLLRRATPHVVAAASREPIQSTAGSSLAGKASRRGRRHLLTIAQAGRGGGKGAEEEPDWEAEMSIFKQRISRPNQLATLRELEAKVNVGKVLFAADGLAVVSGLNADAPLGTQVAFLTGPTGVLLWHRSDNLSFCLVLGDPSSVTEGTPVECKIRGVLQVVDDVKGPITRKDYDTFTVPAGEDMFGRVHDHIGRPMSELESEA